MVDSSPLLISNNNNNNNNCHSNCLTLRPSKWFTVIFVLAIGGWSCLTILLITIHLNTSTSSNDNNNNNNNNLRGTSQAINSKPDLKPWTSSNDGDNDARVSILPGVPQTINSYGIDHGSDVYELDSTGTIYVREDTGMVELLSPAVLDSPAKSVNVFKPSVTLSRAQLDMYSRSARGSQLMQRYLLDLSYPFEFTLKPEQGRDNECHHQAHRHRGLTLVIIVHSALENVSRRDTIRATWKRTAQQLTNATFVFVVGQWSHGAALAKEELAQLEIVREAQRHNDLVQANFVDSYRNLTYKHMAGYRYVLTDACMQRADYVIKCDDDSFVDINAVYDMLLHHTSTNNNNDEHNTEHLLACSVFPATYTNTNVIRARSNKWHVTRQEYRYDTYPSYCSGLMYIITPSLMRQLYVVAHFLVNEVGGLDEKPLWIDDVYIGILLASLVPRQRIWPLNRRYCYRIKQINDWLYWATSNSSYSVKNTTLQSTSSCLVGEVGYLKNWRQIVLVLHQSLDTRRPLIDARE